MSNARRRAIAAVAYEAYRLRAASSRRVCVRALPASCASRGPDASKGLRLQQRAASAAMEHVRKCLQLLLRLRSASYASLRLHLELAAIKALGIRGPQLSL